MTILIFCLALVACILCWTLSRKCPKSPKRNLEFNWRETLTIMSLVLGIIAVGSVVMIVRLSIDIASESIIDKKIEMYQEENTDIEQSIDIVVEEYLKHEHDTFADLKTEESPIIFWQVLEGRKLFDAEKLSNSFLVFCIVFDRIR